MFPESGKGTHGVEVMYDLFCGGVCGLSEDTHVLSHKGCGDRLKGKGYRVEREDRLKGK